MSAVRSARSPAARRPTATAVASAVTHASEPSPTPSTSSSAPPVVPAAPATDAAANTAAHDAIVSGLDAVPPSEVRNARRGSAISSATSNPWRTRSALCSVRSPSRTSTPAPSSPRSTRSGPMLSNGAAPAAPAAA